MGQILMHQITEVQFKTLIETTIREVLADTLAGMQQPAALSVPEGTSEYITRKQAADYLQISLPTLHAYTQKGIVKAVRLGKQVRYRKKDLIAAFESSNRQRRPFTHIVK